MSFGGILAAGSWTQGLLICLILASDLEESDFSLWCVHYYNVKRVQKINQSHIS